MTARLIIIMPTSEDAPGLWGRVDGTKLLSHGRNAPPANDSGEVIAILAGQSVRFYAHELPATSKKDRLRAAGFSIEDKVSEPLGLIHLALDEERIGVIAKSDMQAALDQLSTAGLKPSKAYADFDTLPESMGNVSVLDRIIISGDLGHTLDADWGETFQASTANKISDEDFLIAIAARLETGEALNLLQNDFAEKTNFGLAGFELDWKRFAGLGGVAACLGLAALVLQGAEARALKLQAADLKTQTAQLYIDATGKSAPANPALTATRALKAGGKDNLEFLKLSQILFEGVDKVGGLSVNQLRYQEARHEIQLRLIYPSFESASDFEAAVRAAGGNLKTGGVREQSGEFVGEATLRGGT